MPRDNRQQARIQLQSEQGYVVKDWGGKTPIALVYPNSYYLGMSNLGIHAIYSLLNARIDTVCERVFWDNQKEPQPPVSVESQRELAEFSVVAFSITYELDYFNVPRILKAAGIPIFAKDRDGRHPLVVAGGVCVTGNPMPLAPFFDALCIGEAEVILPGLFRAFDRSNFEDRTAQLTAISGVDGVYVPGITNTPVARQWNRDLNSFEVHTAVVTRDTELGDMFLIEAERGCRWACRFCLVCGIFRPMRIRSVDSILRQAREGLRYRQRLGLVGPDVPDHPEFEHLVLELKRIGARISVSSLRIKPISDIAIGELARGTGTVAFAPEAGSERLRTVIRKGITEDDIIAAMDIASRHPIKQIRLYFMIGLPSEADEDIEAIVMLATKCKNRIERQKSAARITLSIAPFVPKPSTPFQWMPMERLQVLNRRLRMLTSKLRSSGIGVSAESPAWSEVQAALARGGSELAQIIANTTDNSLSAWRAAVLLAGLNTDELVHQRLPTDERLPWDLIDHGTSREALQRDFKSDIH